MQGTDLDFPKGNGGVEDPKRNGNLRVGKEKNVSTFRTVSDQEGPWGTFGRKNGRGAEKPGGGRETLRCEPPIGSTDTRPTEICTDPTMQPEVWSQDPGWCSGYGMAFYRVIEMFP